MLWENRMPDDSREKYGIESCSPDSILILPLMTGDLEPTVGLGLDAPLCFMTASQAREVAAELVKSAITAEVHVLLVEYLVAAGYDQKEARDWVKAFREWCKDREQAAKAPPAPHRM